MVNRGRSKGCAPCRRRKIKCDEQLPCGQCIKRRLECPGPRTGAVFIHTKSTEALPSAVDSSNAFEQLFLLHFIGTFRQAGQFKTLIRASAWLDLLSGFLGPNTLATASIHATTMLSYGVSRNDMAIQKAAHRWYAKVLAGLRRSLDAGSVTDQSLCAAVMLLHFETWTGTRGAWTKHVYGVTAMLQAVGPQACQTGFFYRVLGQFRLQAWVAAMLQSTLHAFAASDWITVPYELEEKHMFDRIVDLLFSCQRCLFAAKLAMQQKHGVDTLQRLVYDTQKQLRTWELDFIHRSEPGDTHGINLSSSNHINGLKPGLNHDLTVVPVASMVSLFHAAALITCRLLSLLQSSDMGLKRLARLHTQGILSAYDFTRSFPGPIGSSAVLKLLPQLRVAGTWGGAENRARDIVDKWQADNTVFAAIVGDEDAYFGEVAAYLDGI